MQKNKRVAILQSNYIPWKGYFDLINLVDEFILFDDVQYTKNDWRNRNKIKTPQGTKWINIPVKNKGRISTALKIKDVEIADKKWAKKHWSTFETYYAKAQFFKDYKDIFKELYLNTEEEYLSEINYKLIKTINNILGITTKISFSSEYELIGGQTEKLVNICKQAKASEYLSGPAAKSYLDENLFMRENINLKWMNYNDYKEYNQLYPPFDHYVSIIDLIFNKGAKSTEFMNSFTKTRIL